MKGYLVSALCILLLLKSGAQTPYVQKIRFNLPSKEPVFQKAFQDSHGFIWLASGEGLYRFDGISFRQVNSPSDPAGLVVTAIHESPDGILWFGCADGKIYHYSKSSLSPFTPEEGTAGQTVSDILTDQDGTTWWSTLGEGIYFYHGSRVFNIDHEDGLIEDYVYDMELDENGMIWAGTDAGLSTCRQDDGRKIVENPAINSLLPDVIVKVVKKDNNGNLWLGFHDSGPGYILPDRSVFKMASGVENWKYGPITDLEVLKDVVWASTVDGYLIEIGLSGPKEILHSGNMPASSAITGKIPDLLGDREGNVWILAASGLFRSTGSKLRFLDKVNSTLMHDIHAIRYDNQSPDRLWFSNDEGLFQADFYTGQTIRLLESRDFKNLKVMCLNEDLYGNIWAGTFNYGVFRINPETGRRLRITEKEGLVNDNVLSISGHNDTLWMATLGGVTEIVLREGAPDGIYSIRSFNRENGLVSNYIYSVFEDPHDRVWFATDGDGISVMEKGKFRTYGKSDGLDDDVVYSITGDRFGNIWIATASEGIYQFNGETFRNYGMDEGLSSQLIAGMVTGGDEVIVILENGLDILHIPSGRIIHLGEEAGLAGISPDLNVFTRDPSGNIWIGAKNGLIRYQPGFSMNSPGPVTILEEMAVYLDPVEMKTGLVLQNNENHVSFKYTGLWLSNPEKVSYQVFLEGYDLGWKNTFDRSVTYSSLPPGNYNFKVRSSTDQSFRNVHEVTFAFRIRQPFWASYWFIMLSVAFIAILVYLFIRYREKRLRRIEEAKKEKVEFEFRLLKNQVNPHFLFNSFSTLMSLIEEEPRLALQYTEKLSDFFRIVLQLKDQPVIRMKEELALIESYFFLLQKRYGNNLILELRLDERAKNSFIPPMTLQILIENAVKHNIISKEKPLKIVIRSEDNDIIVENNLQLKKSPEISTGIGLENISKRYRLKSDKEPKIETSGGVFTVILPIMDGA